MIKNNILILILGLFPVLIFSQTVNNHVVENVIVHQKPDMYSPAIDTLMEGSAIEIRDTLGIWLEIYTGRKIGYINSSAIYSPRKSFQTGHVLINSEGEIGVPYLTLGGGANIHKMNISGNNLDENGKSIFPAFGAELVFPVNMNASIFIGSNYQFNNTTTGDYKINDSYLSIYCKVKYKLK